MLVYAGRPRVSFAGIRRSVNRENGRSGVGFSEELLTPRMAQEKPNPLTEWLHAAQTQVPILRNRAAIWLAGAREDPALIWNTPVIRYGVYGLVAVVTLVSVQTGIGMFSAPAPADAGPTATSADFHVVCSDQACDAQFVVHRKFGFDRFPVECVKCKKATGLSSRRCHSSTCRGRWVAPKKQGKTKACPHCASIFP